MSSTSIANLALGRLGVSRFINALSDRHNEALICNRFYDHCRQEVLQAFPWSHASYSVALAAAADDEYPGWTYVYGYPANVLRVRTVSDSSGVRDIMTYVRAGRLSEYEALRRSHSPFQVALRADGEGRVILSDMPSAYAYGIYDVTNTNVFPPDFKSVLAWRLAMEVGGPLEARADLIANASNQYLIWLSRATARDLNESRDDVVSESPSISCRM